MKTGSARCGGPAFDCGDGAGHGFGSVVGSKKNSFKAGEEFYGVEGGGVGEGVAFADETVDEFDGSLVLAKAELIFGVGAALQVAQIVREKFDAVADGMPTMRQLSDAKRARPIIRPAKVPEELTAEKTSTFVLFSKLFDQLVACSGCIPAAQRCGCADREKNTADSRLRARWPWLGR